MAFNITFKTEALKCTTGSKTSKEPCGTNMKTGNIKTKQRPHIQKKS